MQSKNKSMSVKQAITDKSGFSKIQWCILLVVLALIMAFILSYVVAVNIAQSQQNIATQALDAFIEDNAIRIYSEVKQNSDYTEELLEDEYLKKLIETNGLVAQGTDKYACLSADGRNTKYVITKPEMDFEEDYSAKVILTYTISVPLEFNGRPAIWVDIPITITSRFMPKYEAEKEQQDSNDKTPPSITISIPSGTSESHPYITPYDTVTVMGSVYDQELAMLSINNDRVSVTTGGAFKQVIDLNDGMNIIPVTATDRMGNTTTKYVYVSKEGVIPLDVTVEEYYGVYDGNSHGITVTCAQNAIITYSTTEDGSYTNANPTFTNAGTYTVYYRVEKEGYGTVQNRATVYIEKADNVFTASFRGRPIDFSDYFIAYPVTENITIDYNLSGGTVSVVSNNTSRVTVNGSGNQYSITTLNNTGDVVVIISAAETMNYKEAKIQLPLYVTGCTHPAVNTERASSATCTTAGYTGDIYCSACGDLLETGTTIAALGHNYTVESTDATYLRTSASCTAAATYYHKCSRCTSKGTTYWTHGSASGHNWSAVGTQKSAATCTANSTNWKKCSVCGTQSSTDYWTNSDALGHDYSQQGSLYSNATCTAAAVYYKKCSRCSDQSGTMAVGNALGHDYSKQGDLYSSATCTSPAYYYKKCSRCSSQSGTMAVGNALGHSNTATGALRSNATCTAAATYWYKCSRCGTQSSSYFNSGNALGHVDPGVSCTENRYCARGCGTLYHYAAGHTGGAATCTSNGYCGRCGTLMNNALGHAPSGTVTSYDSSYHYQNCSRCGTSCAVGHTQSSECHYNSNGQHWNPCTGVYNNCWKTYNLTTHTYNAITSQTSTQHTKRCNACWYSVTENHTFAYTKTNATYHKAVCSVCSYTISSEKHALKYTISTNYHTPRCSKCNYIGTKATHAFMVEAGGMKTCGVCGYTV